MSRSTGADKLQNEAEFRQWYAEGKTYAWIVAEYKRKYNVDIVPSTVSNWRHRLGIEERRLARNVELVPWYIKKEHRWSHVPQMLRTEARRRAGLEIADSLAKKLTPWLTWLTENDMVVDYDPDTEEGWWYVPRRHGVDLDIIRKPDHKTRKLGVRD